MDLIEIKKRAEKEVILEYDAWDNLDGADRSTIIYQKMLAILEEDSQDLFKNILLIARDAWENRAWAGRGYGSFVEFLVDVGGRYRQADGRPSGTAYDLEGYICIIWPLLEERGLNPVTVAAENWTKTRLMVATIRKNTAYQPMTLGLAEKIIVTDDEAITRVIQQTIDPDVSAREMARVVCEQRVSGWEATSRLNGDGTWDVSMHMTDQQWQLTQRLLERYIDVRAE